MPDYTNLKKRILEECGYRNEGDPVAHLLYDCLIVLLDLNDENDDWIPCSERLPDDNVPVNITWVNRSPEPYYAKIKDKPNTSTAVCFQGKWFWYSCVIEDWLAVYGSNKSLLANLQEAVDKDIEITAWMPLPEPWEGVGNDRLHQQTGRD